MNRDAILLQGLKNKLQTWLAFIHRAAMATEVKIEPATGPEFWIVVRWKKPEDGEYRKLFDRPTVFGRSMQLTMSAWAVQKCAGDFARDVVRDVLAIRGLA